MSLKIIYFEFIQDESKEISPVLDGMTEIQLSINSKEPFKFSLKNWSNHEWVFRGSLSDTYYRVTENGLIF